MAVPCEQCGRDVVQAVDQRNGRRLLIDPDPHQAGTIRLDTSGVAPTAETVSGEPRLAALAAGDPLYMSHFYTCKGNPDAA